MSTIAYPARSVHAQVAARATVVDRIAIATGNAIAGWGERRALRRSVPSFAQQADAFEAHRDAATRDFPMLPR